MKLVTLKSAAAERRRLVEQLSASRSPLTDQAVERATKVVCAYGPPKAQGSLHAGPGRRPSPTRKLDGTAGMRTSTSLPALPDRRRRAPPVAQTLSGSPPRVYEPGAEAWGGPEDHHGDTTLHAAKLMPQLDGVHGAFKPRVNAPAAAPARHGSRRDMAHHHHSPGPTRRARAGAPASAGVKGTTRNVPSLHGHHTGPPAAAPEVQRQRSTHNAQWAQQHGVSFASYAKQKAATHVMGVGID